MRIKFDGWLQGRVLLQYFALSTISFPDDICSNFSDHPLIIEIILRQHEIFPNQNILYKTCRSVTSSRPVGCLGLFWHLNKGRLDWTLLRPQWPSKIKVENKQDDKETIMLTKFIRTMTRTEMTWLILKVWFTEETFEWNGERERKGGEEDIFLREILCRVGLKDEIYFLLSPFMKDRC